MKKSQRNSEEKSKSVRLMQTHLLSSLSWFHWFKSESSSVGFLLWGSSGILQEFHWEPFLSLMSHPSNLSEDSWLLQISSEELTFPMRVWRNLLEEELIGWRFVWWVHPWTSLKKWLPSKSAKILEDNFWKLGSVRSWIIGVLWKMRSFWRNGNFLRSLAQNSQFGGGRVDCNFWTSQQAWKGGNFHVQ